MAELRKLTTKWTFDSNEYVNGVEKSIEKTRQLSATTDEGQKVLDKYIKDMGGKGKITANQFDVMSASVKKAERESKLAAKAFDSVAKELKEEALMLQMGNDEREVYIAQMRLGAGATDAQRLEVEQLVRANQKLRTSTGGVTSSMRMQRNGFSQLQFQLQDIAVQMQSNTNPFVILGQQGPQIAALFGPRGAVIGSIVAFGAMFGGVALSSLLDFKDATDELEKSQSDLSKVLKESSESGALLSDEMDELVRSYGFLIDEVRELAIVRQLKVAQDSVTLLKEKFEDAKTEFSTIDNSGVESFNAGILGGARIAQETKLEFTELNSVIKDLSSNGANSENVLKLAMAIDNLGTDDASEEMKALKSSLLEQLDVLRRSVSAMADLNDANKDITSTGEENRKNTDQNIKSVTDLVEKLQEEATTYGMTADAIVLYNAAQNGATQEQLESIARSQEIIRTKKAEEQAYKDMIKAGEEEEKARAKNAKNIDRLLDKAFQDQLKRFEQEEQAKIDLENMKVSMAQQSFDNLAQVAEEGSMLAKIAFIGQQVMAAQQVMMNAEVTKAKYLDNPAMVSMIEGQKYASLATIMGATIAGVMHGGGVVPGGDHESTYLLKGGEYVESRAERRQIDNMIENQQGEVNVNLSYNIQALDNKGVKQVLLENNRAVYSAVEQVMRQQGRRL